MTNKIIFSLLFTLSGCSTVDKALRHPFTDYYRIRTDIANVRDSPNSDILEKPVMAMGAGVFIAVAYYHHVVRLLTLMKIGCAEYHRTVFKLASLISFSQRGLHFSH
ncbi:hypothetical protein HVC08_002396 [Salmonella enterica]|nr:hypothetical protein [Salmonella enterica]